VQLNTQHGVNWHAPHHTSYYHWHNSTTRKLLQYAHSRLHPSTDTCHTHTQSVMQAIAACLSQRCW